MENTDVLHRRMVNSVTGKISIRFISVLIVVIVLLIFINALLFVDNLQFKQQNKQLILQNDSLFSVTPKIKSNLDTLKKKKIKS